MKMKVDLFIAYSKMIISF